MSVSRNTTYNLIGGVIPVLTALVSVPLYFHLIGAARYGVLAIAWLLLGYFGLFDLGLGRATSFRIASLRDAPAAARANTFWAALGVNLAMGMVGGAILWIAAGYFFGHLFKVSADLRPEMMSAVPLLAISVPIATLSGVLTGALQGREKFLQSNVVSVLSTVLFQALPLFAAWRLGPNLVMILAAAIGARVLALVVLANMCRVEFTNGHPVRLERGEVPLLLRYGGWVTVASIFGPLLGTVDRFAVGAILGAVSVAIYTVPLQLAKQIQLLPSALTNALFPRISAATPEGQLRIGQEATYAVAALVTLPVLGGLFVLHPVLHLWVGKDIGEQATPVGRILLLGFWANALALVPYTNLQARGRPDLVTKVLLAEIPPYLIGLYFALKGWGLAGAAGVLAVRLTVDYALLSWIAFRALPGWWLLISNFGLLVGGAYCSSLWNYTDWRWWASGVGLGLSAATIAWLTLPASLRARLVMFEFPIKRFLLGSR